MPKPTIQPSRRLNYSNLVKAIKATTAELQGRAAAAVNQALVLRNWLVGAYIVEYEQAGKDRAKYGTELLESLAADLKKRQVKGLGDPRVLRDCRSLYLTYPQIRGSVTRELERHSAPVKSLETKVIGLLMDSSDSNSTDVVCRIVEKASTTIRGSVTRELPTPLPASAILCLSWTKLQELLAIDDPWKRAFFENECLKGNWSVRQLQRQVGSLLYERTGLSTNKKAVIERARRQEPRETIADLIRDPYVLEFTGLAQRPEYIESDLETALLNHLQTFLLELGEGFCFEARQKRITVGRQHDYIDLVFYHRWLRCHVIIDLKIRPFKHADAGQMNFYLNWWKANEMAEGDQPPIGIILCSDRENVVVEFATAGLDNKLFVSRYLTALPSAEKLRAFLEADRDRIESLMPKPAPTKKKITRKKGVR